MPHSNFVIDEEESGGVDMNQDSALFDPDEYYNYNEILNSYFNRQIGRQTSFDAIKEKLNGLITSEK